MEQSTDSELVELARSGDKNAFGQLVERYQQMVKRIAVGMIANEEIARELAQEAILQAYLSLDHLRDSMRFKSWLYGITLNVCRSYVRNQKVDPLSLEAIAGGMHRDLADLLETLAMVDPQVIAEERELHRIVLNAVNHLSPGDRVATLMFYYEQLSQEEIAAILNISVGAVKGRLHRARKQLRDLLAPEYAILRQTATKDRSKKMIKARINSVRINFTTRQRVVILMEEAGRRVLCIWVAHPEAAAIAMALKGETTARPMTAQFMANLLKAIGAQLEEVRIEALKDQIFYAITKVRNGEVVQEIDARPSDALTLALLMDCPIFIAEDVIEKAGVEIPEGETIESVFSHEKGRENLLEKLEAEYEKRGMPFQKEDVIRKIDALYTGKLVLFEEEPSSPASQAREKAFQEFFERWVRKTEGSSAQEASSGQ